MATIVTRYVNTAAAAGGDGTTNATSGGNHAWTGWRAAMTAIDAAYSSNLVSADVQVILLCSGSAADTSSSSYTVPTITMDATRNVVTRPNTGQEHGGKWNTGVYRVGSTNSTNCFTITGASHLVFEGVQFFRDNSSTSSANMFNASAPSAGFTFTARNCVAHYLTRTSIPTDGYLLNITGTNSRTIRVENCVLSGRWFMAVVIASTNAATTLRFANNTVVGSEGGFSCGSAASGAVRAKNNVVIQSADATSSCYVLGTAPTTAKNGSSDATGTSGYQSIAPTWVNAGAFHYQPTAADTTIKGQGVTLDAGAGDADFSFTDDVAGGTRSAPWDIGAWISVSSGGGGRLVGGSLVQEWFTRGLLAG